MTQRPETRLYRDHFERDPGCGPEQPIPTGADQRACDPVNHARSCRATTPRFSHRNPSFPPLEPRQAMAQGLHRGPPMTSFIDVCFQRLDRNPSIESAIHRWVARFEAMRFEVRHAVAIVEAAGRSRTTVRLSVVLAKGTSRTVEATRTDPYVAVSDAFRLVRQQLLAPAAPVHARPTTGRLVA
jgi:hypothetical protein